MQEMEKTYQFPSALFRNVNTFLSLNIHKKYSSAYSWSFCFIFYVNMWLYNEWHDLILTTSKKNNSKDRNNTKKRRNEIFYILRYIIVLVIKLTTQPECHEKVNRFGWKNEKTRVNLSENKRMENLFIVQSNNMKKKINRV